MQYNTGPTEACMNADSYLHQNFKECKFEKYLKNDRQTSTVFFFFVTSKTHVSGIFLF